MEEKTLSPSESLRLITEVISRTQENIRENSFLFLLWGWLIAVASFLFFFFEHYTSFSYFFIPFPVVAIAGVITTLLHFRKRNATATLTHLTVFLSKLWLVLGLSFFTVVFINVSRGLLPFTYTLLIAAIGTLVSGLVMKFNPLIVGGILLFIASVFSVFIPDTYKVLVHGMAIMAGYLIPGYWLKFSSR